ncbi:MAG: transglutaminase-like cysteine peptidase [Gammaproteobacteria bacterium]|jgi:predicted transglutaminase-like cysteine proteinase
MHAVAIIVSRKLSSVRLSYFWVIAISVCAVLIPLTDAQAVSKKNPVSGLHLPASVSAEQAKRNINHWRHFVKRTISYSDVQKLDAVNAFFNDMHFVEDAKLWQVADYWATPLQLVAVGAGDCEDFAIAKFFTLVVLGVPVSQLRMTYVWNFKTRSGSPEPHMVLSYQPASGAETIVLDILTRDINPFSQRRDLQAVYAFNTDGFWLPGENDMYIRAGGAGQLMQWRDLEQRLKHDSAVIDQLIKLKRPIRIALWPSTAD